MRAGEFAFSCRRGLGSSKLAPAAVVALVVVLLGAGCASKASTARPPSPPPEETPKEENKDATDVLARELEQSRAELESARAEIARMHEQVKIAQQEAAGAEERYEALRQEMDRALEEVLASKASLRGMNNRALAISRIAEVRVQMQSARGRGVPEVATRLRAAEALLARADRTLNEGNYGGAAYLADRAGELIRQARTVAEMAAKHTGETARLIPIVPPRTLEVLVTANLRSGPDTARTRVGRVAPGTRLQAVGRLGEWLEVQTDGGRTAWIHRTTVR
jgi:hypothetical protein